MTGYICDGVRYLTESRDVKRKTQNSGIMLKAITQSYASTKDKNPILAEVSFYGILTDIIELYYSKNLKFVLFKCKWVNNSKGLIEKDDYGFTLVNFNHLLYTRHQLSDEPFIFASQAQQVMTHQQLSIRKDIWSCGLNNNWMTQHLKLNKTLNGLEKEYQD
ncbi:hypothetical protein KY285_008010 [Solanum tuberosum]|nr:hypothetical protein KY285_008010 [Solanum tuberosum]